MGRWSGVMVGRDVCLYGYKALHKRPNGWRTTPRYSLEQTAQLEPHRDLAIIIDGGRVNQQGVSPH